MFAKVPLSRIETSSTRQSSPHEMTDVRVTIVVRERGAGNLALAKTVLIYRKIGDGDGDVGPI